MIPPDAQRAMSRRAGATVTETPGSHAVYVSRPEPVAKIIERAARRSLRHRGRSLATARSMRPQATRCCLRSYVAGGRAFHSGVEAGSANETKPLACGDRNEKTSLV